MEFGNPIVGQEELIRSAIKSKNFSADPETGVQGWRIARDGSATFYNLTIGNPNFFIDENGNAVFESVNATTMTLDGENLADLLLLPSRGMVALNQLPDDTAAYNGTDNLLFARIIIPAFDATRQYRVNFVGRFDVVASTPSFIGFRVRTEWDADASITDPILFEQQIGGRTTSATDWIPSVSFVFKNNAPAGTDLHLAFYLFASVAGTRYQGSDYGRVWVEDVGPSVTYGTWTPSAPATQQYTKEYFATDSSSFQEDGDNRSVSECYQGRYSSTNGNQYSMIAFDYATIQADLAGSVIDDVDVYLNNNHSYQNSGTSAIIGTHNQASVTGDHSSSQLTEDLIRVSFAKGEAKYVDVPNSIGEAFRDNTAKGLCLGPGPTTSNFYYAYFAGDGQSGQPRLRIKFTK